MIEHLNRYCERLRIPPPTVEATAARPDVNLFLLMVAALLEHGSPMSLDEIAARLERAALPPRHLKGDLRGVLKKAWHGQPPIVRDTGGRVALDLLHDDWWRVLLSIGLRTPRVAAPPKLEIPAPPDTVPLSAEEVDAAFKGRWLYACSTSRQAAAVLEAAGAPLTVEAINTCLFQLSPHTAGIRDDSIRAWQSDLVVVDPDGALRAVERGDVDVVLQDMNFSRRTSGEEGLELLARIKTPGHHPTNFAWGDDDWRSMYITNIGSVVRIRLNIAGVPSR